MLVQSQALLSPLTPQCHASTLAATPAGLVMACFAGEREGHECVDIRVLRQVGGTWLPAVSVATGQMVGGPCFPCWNPVLHQVPGGPLLLFYKVGPNCADWWGMLLQSHDHGQTWSNPQRLPDGIWGPIKNKPMILPDGSLLCPTSSEHAGWQVWLQRTSDLGKSWTSIGPLNDGEILGAIQPSLLLWAPDRLQLLCRTRQGWLAESQSPDLGKSWEPLRLISLPNPNCGIDAVRLTDGRALLIYNHVGNPPGKQWGSRSPLNLAISNDGRTWDAALVLEDQPGEYSYPAIIQDAAGLVHLSWTWRRQLVRTLTLDPRQFQAYPMTAGQWPAGAPRLPPATP